MDLYKPLLNCSRCNRGFFGKDLHGGLCLECRFFDIYKTFVFHGRLVRCEACAHAFDPVEVEGSDVLEGGGHKVPCPSCGSSVRFDTRVAYEFTSRPLLQHAEAP